MSFIEPHKLVEFDTPGVATVSFPHNLALESLQGGTIDVDLMVSIPKGYHGVIMETKTAFAKGLSVGSKLIHEGYVGPIQLMVRNTSGYLAEFKAGESMVNIALAATIPSENSLVDD